MSGRSGVLCGTTHGAATDSGKAGRNVGADYRGWRVGVSPSDRGCSAYFLGGRLGFLTMVFGHSAVNSGGNYGQEKSHDTTMIRKS